MTGAIRSAALSREFVAKRAAGATDDRAGDRIAAEGVGDNGAASCPGETAFEVVVKTGREAGDRQTGDDETEFEHCGLPFS